MSVEWLLLQMRICHSVLSLDYGDCDVDPYCSHMQKWANGVAFD